MKKTSSTPERFDSSAPKLLIFNFPQNPTGLIPNKEKLKTLAEYLKTNNWIVISDEIYSGLTFKNEEFFSFSQLLPERTIVTNGISKWGASGGWRLGFAAVPKICKPWLKVINSVISETTSCVAAPIQYAAVAAFEDSEELTNFLLISRKSLERIGMFTAKRFREMGADCWDPQGGFYVFPDFSSVLTKEIREKNGIKTGEEFQTQLFDNVGFSILPGEDFERPQCEMTFRASFIDFDGPKVVETYMPVIAKMKTEKEKLEYLSEVMWKENFLNEFGPNIVEGLNKLEEYFSNLK
jgi:aspartate aminotransferase